MNQEIKARWVAALRSGDYQQGFTALCTLGGSGGEAYCCLGVLSDLAVQDGVIIKVRASAMTKMRFGGEGEAGSLNYLVPQVTTWAGLSSLNPFVTIDEKTGHLSNFNDAGYTFDKIADAIEKQL